MSLPNSPQGSSTAGRPTWQEQLQGKPLEDNPIPQVTSKNATKDLEEPLTLTNVLEEHCRRAKLPPPVFNIVSDRRGTFPRFHFLLSLTPSISHRLFASDRGKMPLSIFLLIPAYPSSLVVSFSSYDPSLLLPPRRVSALQKESRVELAENQTPYTDF